MAGISESYNNIKKESRFSHTDYVLLISTICGFSFILIGLLVILVGRRFRSQNSNNAADVELQSPDNGDEETRRLIMKPPVNRRDYRDDNNFTHGNIDNIPAKDDYINMDDYNKKEYDANDSPDNDEQYTKLNEGLFKFMYPQLALYDLFNSPNHSPAKEKPTLLITEITNDEASSITKDSMTNIESECVALSSNDVSGKVKNNDKRDITPLLKVNNQDVYEYESLEEDKYTKIYDEAVSTQLKKVTESSPIVKINDEEEKEDFNDFFEQEPTEMLPNIVKISDDNSIQEESPSSKLSSASNTDSPNLSEVSNDFVEESAANNVVDKLLIIRSPSLCINSIEKVMNQVNNESSSTSQENQDGIDEKVSDRVELLQKDISIFLQKPSNLDDMFEDKKDANYNDEQDLGTIQVHHEESRIDDDHISESHADSVVNVPGYTEPEVQNVIQDLFIKSAGDNIHQDDLLAESPDTSTSTFWPDRNYQLSNQELVPRLRTSTDSINNQTISVSEERIPIIPNQPETILDISDLKMAHELKPMEGFSGNKNFDFSYTMESFKKDFGINDEMITNFGESSETRQFECIPEERNHYAGKQPPDFLLDMDNSQSSRDNNPPPKIVLQTNKNAFTEADHSNTSTKHFYRRNVLETVKLFENVASKSPVGDFKAALRLHRKQK